MIHQGKKIVLKNQDSHPSGNASGWQIVYSGFVLILLCFFVMLSSFSTMEDARVLRFVRSFVRSVNTIMPGGTKVDPGDEILPRSPDIVDKNSDLAGITGKLKKAIKDLGMEGRVGFSYSKEGLVMRLPDLVLFKPGEADISPGSKPLLKDIAAVISKTNNTIRIEGHTDNIPIHTRKFPSNWHLSIFRAVSVLRFFTEQLHLPSRRFQVVGYGEFRPIVPNDTPSNRAKNRRVEIVFVREVQ